MKPLREKLLAARSQRVRPGCDTKRVTAWNALVIKGLAEAGFAFGKREWLERARVAFDALMDRCCRSDGQLAAVWYEDCGPRNDALLEDYACTAEAALALAGRVDWLKSGASARYLEHAKAFAERVLVDFADPHATGYFTTGAAHEPLAVRKKDWFDNAMPSGNATMANTLAGLYAVFGDTRYHDALAALRPAYSGLARRAPGGVAHALTAFTNDAVGIAVVKCGPGAEIEPLRAALAERPARACFVIATGDAALAGSYQVCVSSQCLTPVADATEAAERVAS